MFQFKLLQFFVMSTSKRFRSVTGSSIVAAAAPIVETIQEEAEEEDTVHDHVGVIATANDNDNDDVIASISTFEEMNPARRCSHEDCSIYEPAGTWGSPDPDMALLAVCDGHGGRDMVDYLEHGLVFHVGEELRAAPISTTQEDYDVGGGDRDNEEHRQDENDDGNANSHPTRTNDVIINDIPIRLERAFLMADIHSKTLGVKTSGATVALCLVKGAVTVRTKPDLPNRPPKQHQRLVTPARTEIL
jgi:hypothetical protein